jgi:hypothetical protein
MDKVINFLKEENLATPSRIEAGLLRGSISRVLQIQEKLDDILRPNFGVAEDLGPRSISDPFNFVASASIRGDRSCMIWECRHARIRNLARYAALYCDKVRIPLWIPRAAQIQRDDWNGRYIFAGTLLSVLELRPIAEGGIIEFVPDYIQLCSDHLKQAIPSYPRIDEVRRRFLSKYLNRFHAEYEPPSKDVPEPTVRITGPSDFIEHGEGLRVLNRVPDWAPRMTGSVRNPKPLRLSSAAIRKSGLVDQLFNSMASDLYLQQFYGIQDDASYLTDLPGEAEFFRAVSHHEHIEASTVKLCSRLVHTVPLLAESSLDTVMRIRRQDHESFLVYRNTLMKIVRDYIKTQKIVSDREAREIYTDILQPEITKLSNQARIQRRAAGKKFAIKAGVSGVAIALGVWGGLLPAELAGLFKAVGGFNLLKEIGEALASMEKNPAEIRNHNLYFLLRLKEQTPHR